MLERDAAAERGAVRRSLAGSRPSTGSLRFHLQRLERRASSAQRSCWRASDEAIHIWAVTMVDNCSGAAVRAGRGGRPRGARKRRADVPGGEDDRAPRRRSSSPRASFVVVVTEDARLVPHRRSARRPRGSARRRIESAVRKAHRSARERGSSRESAASAPCEAARKALIDGRHASRAPVCSTRRSTASSARCAIGRSSSGARRRPPAPPRRSPRPRTMRSSRFAGP